MEIKGKLVLDRLTGDPTPSAGTDYLTWHAYLINES
jgi:hypothetical protein